MVTFRRSIASVEVGPELIQMVDERTLDPLRQVAIGQPVQRRCQGIDGDAGMLGIDLAQSDALRPLAFGRCPLLAKAFSMRALVRILSRNTAIALAMSPISSVRCAWGTSVRGHPWQGRSCNW